jgi:hypothetical protein
MPIDPRRRHEITLAVVAYDSANPQARLPRYAAHLDTAAHSRGRAPIQNTRRGIRA